MDELKLSPKAKQKQFIEEQQLACDSNSEQPGVENRDRLSKMKTVFDQMDTDGSGDLSLAEFLAGVQELHPDMSAEKAKELFCGLDVDQSETLSMEEFKLEWDAEDEVSQGHQVKCSQCSQYSQCYSRCTYDLTCFDTLSSLASLGSNDNTIHWIQTARWMGIAITKAVLWTRLHHLPGGVALRSHGWRRAKMMSGLPKTSSTRSSEQRALNAPFSRAGD
jgi:hypothetical protein